MNIVLSVVIIVIGRYGWMIFGMLGWKIKFSMILMVSVVILIMCVGF